MDLNQIGMASVSLVLDSSGGSNEWIDLQLRGFDVDGNQLFAKRTKTISIAKAVTEYSINHNLEFYFGTDVAYFEVWFRAKSTLSYENPAITVIKF